MINQSICEDSTLLPRVRYNYAYALYKLDCFDEALEVAHEILLYLKTRQLMYSLGKVYHMIGLLSKNRGFLDEAEEAFNNAILLFTLTKDQQNLNRAEKDYSSLQDTF